MRVDKNMTREDLDWQSVFDAFPDMIAIIDKNHRIVKANKAMALKLGCTTEQLTGCSCFKVVHELESIPGLCPHARTLASGQKEHSEIEEIRLGRIADITTVPLFNSVGELVGSLHVARDITVGKEKIQLMLEEALHKSEQQSRALLDAFPDLIFRLDRGGRYLDCKAPKDELFFQSSSIVGKKNRDITPPEFADLIESKISLTLETGKMMSFEYQLEIPGKGCRDFEARMVPSGSDEVIAIARDITERKKTDKALKKKFEELEWFNHMMIDRELRMIELKREINELLLKSGEPEKYTVHQ